MQIDTILIKVASRCNINCSYCYVYNLGDDGWKDMPHFISKENIEFLSKSLAAQMQDQESRFATVLHGGEPFMLGPRRLEFLLKNLRKFLTFDYPISIQTNGTLITNEILDICSKYQASLSISIDGPQEINDKYRVDKKGLGTHSSIVSGINLLRAHPDSKFLYAGILAVIDPSTNPSHVYHSLKELGSSSINFLPQDGNHSSLPMGKESLNSTEYGNWLISLLNEYIVDDTPPRVRILDDLLSLSLGGKSVKEGVGEDIYNIVIIETDGSIAKNDTLKSSYPGADRFNTNWNIRENKLSDVIKSNIYQEYNKIQTPSSKECLSCDVLNICGGGMPLHRWSDNNFYDNPSVYCADQKLIINEIKSILRKQGIMNDI